MAVSRNGDGHQLLTPDIIAKEALMRLKHALIVPRLATSTYERYFSDKIGDTVTVKKPFKAVLTSMDGGVDGNGRTKNNRVLANSAFTPMVDEKVEISVDERHNFAMKWTDIDRTLHITDFANRYLQTLVEELAYKYDEAGAAALVNGIGQSDGTPGSEITTKSAQDTRAHATHVGIPKGSANFVLMDPVDIAELSDDIKNINVPDMVQGAIRESFQGKTGGWSIFESVHIPTLDNSALAAGTVPLVRGANQTGSTINLDGFANSTDSVLKKGQLISFAGVNQVKPRGTRSTLSYPATFTVTEDADSNASGQVAVKISPELTPTGTNGIDGNGASVNKDAFQNVSNSPANDAVVTIVGTTTGANAAAAARYRQAVFFHRDALHYVNVALVMPESAEWSAMVVDNETGLSISMVKDWSFLSLEEMVRMDTFFGVKCIYPELGIRHITGSI